MRLFADKSNLPQAVVGFGGDLLSLAGGDVFGELAGMRGEMSGGAVVKLR